MRQRDPDKAPRRVQRDAVLSEAIRRVWEENFRVYGGAQGLAAACARRQAGRPVHGSAADEGHGLEGRQALQDDSHHDQQQGCALHLIGGGRPAPDRAASYNTGLSRYLDFMDSYLAPGGFEPAFTATAIEAPFVR